MLLKYAFDNTSEGFILHSRSTGKLFNLARLKAKTKIRKVLISEMFFADDAAVISYTEDDQREPTDRFSCACKMLQFPPTFILHPIPLKNSNWSQYLKFNIINAKFGQKLEKSQAWCM